ncbi:MAG: hypothetical protein KKA32_03040 [Actinobacteria bacterium]|nr:hypothetical protein [Actinomycetota bacterium]
MASNPGERAGGGSGPDLAVACYGAGADEVAVLDRPTGTARTAFEVSGIAGLELLFLSAHRNPFERHVRDERRHAPSLGRLQGGASKGSESACVTGIW